MFSLLLILYLALIAHGFSEEDQAVSTTIRSLTTTVVNTEGELRAASVSGSVIEFASDITLRTLYNVTAVTGLTINGNGYEIDGDNLYHIAFFYCFEVEINHLTIRNGFSALPASAIQYGGGLTIYGDNTKRATYTLNHVTITNCQGQYGGGILVTQAEFSMNYCSITNCTAQSGGAMRVTFGRNNISHSYFANNEASLGGGLTVAASSTIPCSLLIKNSTFVSNIALTGEGAAINIPAGDVVIEDSTIVNNTAFEDFGGGIYFISGSLVISGLTTYGNIDRYGPDDLSGTSVGCVECFSDCAYGEYATCKGALGAPHCAVNCVCSKCPAGRFIDTFGSTSIEDCISCPAGQISDTGAATCSSCSPGTYASDNASEIGGGLVTQVLQGATTCNQCPAGYFTSSSSNVVCQACASGKTSSVGNFTCFKCARGTYSSSGDGTCTKCSAGFVSSEPGASSCTACLPGTSSAKGSATCNLAAENYFIASMEPVQQVMFCPNHASCYGGLRTPIPDTSFWVDHTDYDYAGHIYKCFRSTCKGGSNQSTCWELDSFNNSEYCSQEQCLKGSQGPLCGSCTDGYVYDPISNVCKDCKDTKIKVLVLSGVIFLLLLLTYFISNMNAAKCLKKRILSLSGFVDTGTLKVLWVTYQIIASSTYTLTIKFPYPYSAMLRVLSIFSLDILALECLDLNLSSYPYYDKVYLWCVVPILLALLIVIVAVLRLFCAFSYRDIKLSFSRQIFTENASSTSSSSSSTSSDSISNIITGHIWLLLLLSYIVLPAVSNKQLQSFDCIELVSGKKYLRDDTSISCQSDTYRNFRSVVILFVVVYQLIPILWMFLLYRNRRALTPQSMKFDKNLALFTRDNDPDLAYIRFLFIDYKCNKWWFEVLDMYRRIIFVSIIPLVSTDAATKASFGLILGVLGLVYFSSQEPYRVDITNSIAFIAQVSIVVTFYSALTIETVSLVNFGLTGNRLGVFLVCINLLILMLTIYFALDRYRAQKQEKVRMDAKATSVEWAVYYNADKFKSTFEAIALRDIPSSDVMLFYYCSTMEAAKARKSGIPAQKKFNGIPLTMRHPHNTRKNDFKIFNNVKNSSTKLKFPNEELLVLSLPRQYIDPLPGYEDDAGLWVLSSTILKALKPNSFVRVADSEPWLNSFLLLPPHCIIQRFVILENTGKADSAMLGLSRIVEDEELIERENNNIPQHASRTAVSSISSSIESVESELTITVSSGFDDGLTNDSNSSIEVLQSIEKLVGIMSAIRIRAHERGLIPLYHYTSRTAAGLILRHGFRASGSGAAHEEGGGVYFTTRGPACYGLGSEDYELNVIRDFYGVDKIQEYENQRSLNTVIVYGCSGRTLEKGSKEGTLLFSKSSFGHFSLADLNGNYFLRKDRILGCFRIDDSVVETFDADSADHLRNEISKDIDVERNLMRFQVMKNSNSLRVDNFFEEASQLASFSSRNDSSSLSSAAYSSLIRTGTRIAPLQITSSFLTRSLTTSNNYSSEEDDRTEATMRTEATLRDCEEEDSINSGTMRTEATLRDCEEEDSMNSGTSSNEGNQLDSEHEEHKSDRSRSVSNASSKNTVGAIASRQSGQSYDEAVLSPTVTPNLVLIKTAGSSHHKGEFKHDASSSSSSQSQYDSLAEYPDTPKTPQFGEDSCNDSSLTPSAQSTLTPHCESLSIASIASPREPPPSLHDSPEYLVSPKIRTLQRGEHSFDDNSSITPSIESTLTPYEIPDISSPSPREPPPPIVFTGRSPIAFQNLKNQNQNYTSSQNEGDRITIDDDDSQPSSTSSLSGTTNTVANNIMSTSTALWPPRHIGQPPSLAALSSNFRSRDGDMTSSSTTSPVTPSDSLTTPDTSRLSTAVDSVSTVNISETQTDRRWL